jgi:hypothetical protein
MEKIDSLKKIKEISDYIITLSVFAFISGIIIFIWFGFGLGLKIIATSFVLMIFFRNFSESTKRLIIKAEMENNNETD